VHAPVKGDIVRRRPCADRLCAFWPFMCTTTSTGSVPESDAMSAAHQTLNKHSTAGPKTETPILAMAIARIAAVYQPPMHKCRSEFIPNLSRAEP